MKSLATFLCQLSVNLESVRGGARTNDADDHDCDVGHQYRHVIVGIRPRKVLQQQLLTLQKNILHMPQQAYHCGLRKCW